jgi:hypothetical protein
MRIYTNSTDFTAAVTADFSIDATGTGTGVTATCKSLRSGLAQDVAEAVTQTLTTKAWDGGTSGDLLAPSTNGQASGALEITLSAAAIALSVATSGTGFLRVRMIDSNGVELPAACCTVDILNGYCAVYADAAFTRIVLETDSGGWGVSAITGLLA